MGVHGSEGCILTYSDDLRARTTVSLENNGFGHQRRIVPEFPQYKRTYDRGKFVEIHRRSRAHAFESDVENLLPSVEVGGPNVKYAIESPGPEKRRILQMRCMSVELPRQATSYTDQTIRPVRSGDHDDTAQSLDAIHFIKQARQDTVANAGASRICSRAGESERIDLVL